jgi:hypothetical protein
MPLQSADVHVERVTDDGIPYIYITITAGAAGGFSPDSFVTKGLSTVARAFERGSDRFNALLRTRDESLAAEWTAVLRTTCGRERTHNIEKLQAAIAQGDVQLASRMAEDLASLTAAVPGGRQRTQSFSGKLPSNASERARNSGSPPISATAGGEIDLVPPLQTSYVRPGVVAVPARVHTPRGASSQSSAEESDADVPEVSVVLHPAGPSEKQKLRERLAAVEQIVAVQRAALQSAHAALSTAGQAAAADAVAGALAQTAAAALSATPASGPLAAYAQAYPPAGAAPASVPIPGSSIPAVTAMPAVPSTEHVGAAAVPPDAGAGAATAAEETPPPEEEPAWVEVDGKPKAGFTTADEIAKGERFKLLNGDGRMFTLRIGPDYKKHGKKAASGFHTYEPITIDVFKRKSILYHAAERLTLPPPPDGRRTPNTSGLPRLLVVNVVLPLEAPSLLGGSSDGECYQVVITFGASSEKLSKWQAEGSPAAKLFARFNADCPEGLMPTTGDLELKERLKLLPKVDNMKQAGLGWVEKYNGKPALMTRSGSIYRGDDYLEMDMNTYRFAYITKKGINGLLGRLQNFEFHAAVTIEGRENDELPEQVILACRIHGLELEKLAKEVDLPEP